MLPLSIFTNRINLREQHSFLISGFSWIKQFIGQLKFVYHVRAARDFITHILWPEPSSERHLKILIEGELNHFWNYINGYSKSHMWLMLSITSLAGRRDANNNVANSFITDTTLHSSLLICRPKYGKFWVQYIYYIGPTRFKKMWCSLRDPMALHFI